MNDIMWTEDVVFRDICKKQRKRGYELESAWGRLEGGEVREKWCNYI